MLAHNRHILCCILLSHLLFTACQNPEEPQNNQNSADESPDFNGSDSDMPKDLSDETKDIEQSDEEKDTQQSDITKDIEQDEDFDEFCHHDCFGSAVCENGQVTVYEHTPIACGDWTGSCPSAIEYQCKQGCAIKQIHDPWIDPKKLCVEEQPNKVGDPCESDEQCKPPDTTYSEQREPIVSYLFCDTQQGTCQEGEPPVIEGYLEECQIENTGRPFGAFGAIEGPNCPGDICLIYGDRTNNCIAQACTQTCTKDQDCPQGSTCTTGPWHGERSKQPTGYCKPGPPNLIGVGFSCSP